ncbi:YsnF/AvaK domain-containing protein [Alsobacter sp. SYSU BS001988]
MTRTVTAMFDSYQEAAEAVRRLEALGLNHSAVSLVSNDPANRERISGLSDNTADNAEGGGATGATLGGLLGGGAGLLAGLGLMAIPGVGPVVALGWLASTLVGAGAGAATGGLIGALTGAGVSEEDAHTYAEGVRRGGSLVTVRTDDALYDKVVDILDDDGTVNIDERESTWRKEGWNGRYEPGVGATGTTSSTPGVAGSMAASTPASPAGLGRTGAGMTGAGTTGYAGASGSGVGGTSSGYGETGRSGEQVIPVAEERLNVGKREVNEGRVRVRSYTVEKPVTEQVNLREEHVDVSRRPVDRPVSGDPFRERTIEATETSERPVVEKQARVVGEVAVNKDVRNTTQTVSDTVRKTEVDIEDSREANRFGTGGQGDRRT